MDNHQEKQEEGPPTFEDFGISRTPKVVQGGPSGKARLICVCIASGSLITLGVVIAVGYHRSSQLIFRAISADSTVQRLCKNLFLFLDLQTFDLQLNLTMVLLILRSGTSVDTKDIAILAVGIPVTIACFAIGYISVRKENKRVGYVYGASLFLAPGYIIFKIYQSVYHWQNSTTTWGTSQQSNALFGTTVTCAAAALIIRLLMGILFVKVFNKYDNGLKEKVFGGHQNIDTMAHPTYGSVENIN